MSNYIEYFNSISFRISILKRNQEEYDLYLASKFNLLQYVYLDENTLSDILMNLLNPKGNHGQKNAFLNKFIDILSLDENLKNKIPKVTRESRTDTISNNKRRIDILIAWEDFAIGIENKPLADDQFEQLKDYSEHLTKKFKDNYILIYLSENPPTEYSISKIDLESLKSRKKFGHITFTKDLFKWLNNCIKESQSDKIRYFLKDFILKIKEYLSMSTVENSNEIVDYSLSSNQNLEIAYNVYQAFPAILEKIASDFDKKISDRLKEKYGQNNVEIISTTEHDRINISFRKKSWIDGTLCSIFDENKYGERLYLSIITKDDKFTFYEKIKKKIEGEVNDFQWWVYPTKFNKWMYSIEEMKLMREESAVNFFIDELENLIDCVDELLT